MNEDPLDIPAFLRREGFSLLRPVFIDPPNSASLTPSRPLYCGAYEGDYT